MIKGHIALCIVTAGFADACAPRNHHAAIAGWSESRRCPFGTGSVSADSVATAVRCAEAFISRNGYADSAPLSDTLQLAAESLERGPSWVDVLKTRRGSLEGQAVGYCIAGSTGLGFDYTIVFPYRGRIDGERARAVTMRRDFSELRVEHQDFMLAAVLNEEYACKRTPARQPSSKRDDGVPPPNER
jgi:hypothetical protein